MMPPRRQRHSAEYSVCALLLLLVLLPEPARTGTADAALESVEEVYCYGRTGSGVLFQGVTTELSGEGVLEWWFKERGGRKTQWILTYYFGTNESEMHQKYKNRADVSFKNASLQLWNLTKLDTGDYDLMLKFKLKLQIHLDVLDPIEEIKVVPILSLNNCISRLICEASGDVWNFTWKEDGKEVFHNITRDGNVSELVIGPDSTSVYTCEASNTDMKLEKSYQPAQDSFVGLFVFSFRLAGFIFSVPMLILWLNVSVCRTAKYCHNVKKVAASALSRLLRPLTRRDKGDGANGRWVNLLTLPNAVLVCWILFLLCALTATSCVRASPIPYGDPVLNVICLATVTILLTIEVLWFNNPKMFPEYCNCCNGACSQYEKAVKKKGKTLLLVLRLGVFGLFGFTVGNYFYEYFSTCRQPPAFGWVTSISVLVPAGSIALIHWSCHRFGPRGGGDDKQTVDGGLPDEHVQLNSAETGAHVQVATGESVTTP